MAVGFAQLFSMLSLQTLQAKIAVHYRGVGDWSLNIWHIIEWWACGRPSVQVSAPQL